MATDLRQAEVGQRLREARLRARLTVGAVAQKMHRSRQAIHAWEAGDALPGILQLADLMVLYSASSDVVLFGGVPGHLRGGLGVLWDVFGRAGVPDPKVSGY